MGNSSGKESRPSSALGHHGRGDGMRHGSSSLPTSPPAQQQTHDRHASQMYASRGGRGSRPDLSFLGIAGREERVVVAAAAAAAARGEPPQTEQRRETKAEREARKLEKERVARAKERERSMREEGVDGGYLVTLGTYTGTEDFSKPVVRQLMIERRLAPFWKGLNDFKETWVEHQLVAAAQGKEIPPADEVPPDESPKREEPGSRPPNLNLDSLTVPITGRSQSTASDRSANLSPSHPAFSLPSPTSPLGQSPSSSAPFFRGRAKTLASLTSSSRNNSQTDMTPQETVLPSDIHVNGMRVEAFLYKDASECPICFMYYPPYLNKTRCCDQPICSECFVQIKRPDPHPPEHQDPNNPDATGQPQSEDCMLVSEPAACPFCVQPEFGVTYEPPPFRRGLVYAHQSHMHPLAHAASAMSSSSSLNSQGLGSGGSNSASRRRTTSLSANASAVITTDKVRPDWAKKLADARAHALRRAAAATALHNAAYVLGGVGSSDGRTLGFGRRRRTIFSDSPNSSGRGTPRYGEVTSLSSVGALIAASERHAAIGRPDDGSDDLYPGRNSSRRTRVEDLEELMMMEAIRLSLAAEEERKRKEEKENAKENKKEEKRKAKEAKKAEKAARRGGGSGPYMPAPSDLEQAVSSSASLGKGKAVDRSGVGFNPLSEPTSTVNAGAASRDDPQRHLEESRAQIQSQMEGSHHHHPTLHGPLPPGKSSTRTSSASSLTDSAGDSASLGNGNGNGGSADHTTEDFNDDASSSSSTSPSSSPSRPRGDSGESSASAAVAPPSVVVTPHASGEHTSATDDTTTTTTTTGGTDDTNAADDAALAGSLATLSSGTTAAAAPSVDASTSTLRESGLTAAGGDADAKGSAEEAAPRVESVPASQGPGAGAPEKGAEYGASEVEDVGVVGGGRG